MSRFRHALVLLMLCVPATSVGYPLDAAERTKIRRLGWQHEIETGQRTGRKIAAGGTWPSANVTLRMKSASTFELTGTTPKDEALQAGLEQILKKNAWKRYNVALLDITDPTKPRYAAVNETAAQTPGSVAKLLLAAAVLDALAERYPKDTSKREAILRDTMVVADHWAMPNSHEVPVVSDKAVSLRAVRTGDMFSLWEWMDHAISPSSNAAGTIVWREATLMKLLGDAYPPEARGEDLFKRWERAAFTTAVFDAVDAPLRDAKIPPESFRIRSFFTTGASRYIHSESSSATPLGLLQWGVRIEQGRMIDEWSSLELKRLMYVTRKRIRYGASEKLASSAVFFKSGSYFKCVAEAGYTCGKYRGNAVNVLNSLTIVETAPTGGRVYLVAVMSNELKRNAASDHALLASAIHDLIERTAP